MDAAAYYDRIATVYDARYASLEGDDVAFYRDLATDVDGPVLEVGCGSGRIYLELLRAGVDAHGIDVSRGMLAVLEERAAEEGLEPSVRTADVTAFEPERAYELVIVPFRAFLHLAETEAQLSALERVHDALGPGGELALNAFVPNFEVICERYGEWDETELEVDGDRYAYRTKTELADEVEQVATIRSQVFDADGDLVDDLETPIALLSRRDFDLLFRLSPFEEWTVAGGFDGGALESAEQEMVWTARRSS